MNSFGSFQEIPKNDNKALSDTLIGLGSNQKLFKDQIFPLIQPQIADLKKSKKFKNSKNLTLALLPYPEELESEGGLRRMGIETASANFYKTLKTASWRGLDLENSGISFVSLFEDLGFNSIKHERAGYRGKLKGWLEVFGEGSGGSCVWFGVGGGLDFAETYLREKLGNEEFGGDGAGWSVFKIGPSLNCGGLGEKVFNKNAFSHLSKNFGKIRIYHFGVLAHQTPSDLVQKVEEEGEDGQQREKVYFLGEDGFNFSEFFEVIQEVIQREDRLIMVFDCESIASEYFQGVSDPRVDGLDKKEVFSIFKNLAKFTAKNNHLDAQKTLNLDAVLIGNFNPTVEAMRSPSMLNTILYAFLATLADSRAKSDKNEE